jgi:secreted PhoX family phosphatase
MQPIYTINDTAYYPMKTCLGALCPTNGTPYMQNTLNNAIPPAGAYFASCPGGAVAGCATAGPSSFADVSNDPDYMSMLSVGGNLYSVIHFETIPAAMYMMQLNMAANGELSVTPGSLTAIDWSASGGILNPCAGSTTPWQSHLGSEESVGLDGRDFAGTFLGVTSLSGYNTVSINSTSTSGVPVIMRYFGVYPNTLTPAVVVQNLQPYNYGYINEVVVTGPGAYTTKKHYAMGRTPWEMAYIMPDNKTVYGASDKTNGMFNKFVSNTAGDLSSGTLYCAAMTQTSAANAGSFTINWLSMGALSDATIAGWVGATANATVAAGLSFDDIFVTDLPTGNVTGACNAGFISVNTGYSYKVAGVTYYNECLKLNPANPNAAAQAAAVESLRYAAMIGCTTEFNKWEGITYSPKRKQLYTAMSYWTSAGMLASTTSSGAVNTGDIGGSQDIALAAQPCGCVYYLNVDATYSATDMSALVCGTAQTADAQGNTCSVNSIASPDNVIMMDDFDTLIIGEDTGSHRIDYIWQARAGPGLAARHTQARLLLTRFSPAVRLPQRGGQRLARERHADGHHVHDAGR